MKVQDGCQEKMAIVSPSVLNLFSFSVYRYAVTRDQYFPLCSLEETDMYRLKMVGSTDHVSLGQQDAWNGLFSETG